MFRPALFFAAGLLAAGPVAAQPLTAAESAKVDAIVAAALKSSGVPSASIAIVRGGEIAFAKAYGRQGPGMPVANKDAKYQIASVSKQFTAAAILMLEDEGKLSLDDTVAKWVPGITGGERITIRQLLSHTAGIQDYWPQDYSFAAMEVPTTPQGIVDRWAKKPLDFEPGTQWQYSNTGFVVAGMIIEKASGTTLLDYLNGHVFKPLGIDAMDQDLAIGKGYPTGYHRFALGPVRAAKPAAHGWLWAAGELAMSASDLAKWDVARINRSLLPADDWAVQETAIKLADGKSSNYGLGVQLAEQNGIKIVSHGGEAVGFLTDNTVIPSEKFAVVVAVNADFADAQSTISRKIREMFVPRLAPPASDAIETARTELARQVYAGLQKGQIDRARFTSNGNYYFTAQAVADYHTSLAPLGKPISFEPIRGPRLRGGFVNRNYTIVYPGRKLIVVTYADPGKDGKIEQFMVMPAN